MSNQKIKKDQGKLVSFSRLEKFHPYKTFLFFALLGSTVVFMAITFLYLVNLKRTLPPEDLKLPDIFFISTLLLLFSSYSVSKILAAFRNDSFKDIFMFLGMTLVSGILFTTCQVWGWSKLFESGFPLSIHNRVSFFYVITGIHFIHVFAGLVILSYIMIQCHLKSKDAVKALLYFSNNYNYTKFELAVIFWHFVDFLWLGLFLIFLCTF